MFKKQNKENKFYCNEKCLACSCLSIGSKILLSDSDFLKKSFSNKFHCTNRI